MDESRGSWGQLVLSLIGQFLLLRDFFGYLVPGFIFMLLVGFGAVVFHGTRLPTFFPTWVVILIVVVVSYVSGHLFAALGFALQDFGVRFSDIVTRSKRKRAGGKGEFPLKFESLVLYYRATYPQLFVELDRRDTLALLRTGAGTSFLIGCWSWPHLYWRVTLIGIGTAFLASGFVGRRHVALYRLATLRAALRMQRHTHKS